MPNLPFSISRWFGKSVQPENDDVFEEYQFSSTGECYECTQVGVPVFHSTSCDKAHQPEWEASAGSSLLPIKNQPANQKSGRRILHGGVLDPRTKRVQRWNRAFLLARGMALAVDPLFFYVLSIGRGGSPCLYMDGGLAAAVAVLRTCIDAVHLAHLWLQFRLAYVSRESLVVGCGKLVWDPRVIAAHYLRSLKGFWFDVFVILPVPQAAFWLVVPRLIREEQIKLIMTLLLLIFLFQFLPKVYHSICLMRRMQKVTGYIFGTIWWGFGLNLIAYFIASHVAGGCWYVLAIQRVASCLKQHCNKSRTCNLSLSCSEEVCYQFLPGAGTLNNPCGGNSTVIRKPLCLDVNPITFHLIFPIRIGMTTTSRSLIRRLAPYFSARVHRNSRLLSSSSAVRETHLSSSEYPSPSADAVHLTNNCVRRIKELQAEEASKKLLRLSIEAGGCSGFQYNFLLDDKTNDDDRIFEKDGVKLVVDNISFDFVKGATVDYVEELIRSAFQVSTNPSAVGGCSCKSSFMVK